MIVPKPVPVGTPNLGIYLLLISPKRSKRPRPPVLATASRRDAWDARFLYKAYASQAFPGTAWLTKKSTVHKENNVKTNTLGNTGARSRHVYTARAPDRVQVAPASVYDGPEMATDNREITSKVRVKIVRQLIFIHDHFGRPYSIFQPSWHRQAPTTNTETVTAITKTSRNHCRTGHH